MFIQSIINSSFFNIKFKKAILVGSSGDIIGENKGQFINSFPVIIRMNDAKTIGFEKDVGNRTTIRIVNFNALSNILNTAFLKEFLTTEYLILSTNNSQDKYKLIPLQKMFPRLKLFIFTPQAIEHNDMLFHEYTGIHRKTSGSWLSTGWFSLFFMIHYIEDKNIIGFGGEKENSSYHYYSAPNTKQKNYYIQQESASHGHRFITEKKIFNKWIPKYNLKFHKL
jgi:N-acetylgalactosaminide alpha-2,6-sialyltransferase (sialyltransferase 7D)